MEAKAWPEPEPWDREMIRLEGSATGTTEKTGFNSGNDDRFSKTDDSDSDTDSDSGPGIILKSPVQFRFGD